MNLIARITILFGLVSLLVFGIGGIISYRILMREVEAEQQRFLLERLERIEQRIRRIKPVDTMRWNKMVTFPIDDDTQEHREFSDTLVMHSQLERMESHLKLDAVLNVDGQGYRVILYDVIIEEDDIKDGLTESLTKMYLLLIFALLIISGVSSYFILRPFKLTLGEIKQFSLKDPNQHSSFPTSGVKEFNRLNAFLKEMTDKMRSDYKSLKEFSENASHEFQTPIAIIQSKLDVLLDEDSLQEAQLEQLSAIQNATKRLSNISNSLALLTKIENNEFVDVSRVNASELVGSLLKEFTELFDLKDLKLSQDIDEHIVLESDKVLIELMFTNLISNEIRYNMPGGKVELQLNEDRLMISNTGPELTVDPAELFERFKKSNQSGGSLGLGLAIVKKICECYGYQVSYQFAGGIHTIQITFSPLAQTS